MRPIVNRTAPVLLIHPSQSVRVELRTCISSLEFLDPTTGSTLSDAKKFVKLNPHGWVICPMFSGNPETAIDFLNSIVKDSKLSGVRVTLVVDELELGMLPDAFQSGLMSWIQGPLNKNVLHEHISNLLELGKKYEYSATRIAADSLRKYLDLVADYDNVFRLEKSMQLLFPRDGRPVLSLAKVMLRKGYAEESKLSFRQALSLSPDLKPEIDDYLEKDGSELARRIKISLGFNAAMIVDPDPAIIKALTSILCDEFKVPDVRGFTDSLAAWKEIEKGWEPNMIFQEWKLQGLGGPQFLQRIRHHGLTDATIMVVSSLIEKSDLTLLSEMLVYQVLPKPFQSKVAIETIQALVEQDHFPTAENAITRKVHIALQIGDFEQALKYKSKLEEMPGKAKGTALFLEAKILYAQKFYDEAKKSCMNALRILGGDHVQALDLLGKTLMNLNELEAAIKIMEKAQALSPKNVQRICEISIIQSESGSFDKADEALEKAASLDPGSQIVKESKVKATIVKGDKKSAQDLVKDLENIRELVAQMNNRAVAYVRSNAYPKAMDIYKKTLAALPTSERDLRARVLYNMGLAAARQGNVKESNSLLFQASSLGETSISAKIGSLSKKVEKSIQSGKPLKLNIDEEVSTGASPIDIFSELKKSYESSDDSIMGQKPEDMGRCLHKIFFQAG